MSGTLRAIPVLTPEQRYLQEQQRLERLRAEARRRAEERARFEAARQQAGKQMMALEAQRYNAANAGLIMPTPAALKQEIARAESESRQQSAASALQALAQAQAESHQRALDTLKAQIQQFADQQRAADAAAAATALEDARTLAVESQMWVAAGAPGNNFQASAIATAIQSIYAMVATRPEDARGQATALAERLRAQRDELAREHFRRWSSLLGDCSFELGRIQALQERLTESGLDSLAASHDQRVGTLLTQLTARTAALTSAVAQDQQYSLDLADVSAVVEHAGREYDALAEQTFDLIAEHQQKQTIATIAEALAALGYHDSEQRDAAPQVERIGEQLAVIAVRQNPNSQTVDEKVVSFFVDELGNIDADFSGFADRECDAAAAEVFAEFRRRGLALVREDAAIRLRNADPATLATDPEAYAGPEFAPRLDNSKRQPELRRRVLKALERMGFQSDQIHEEVHGGIITINASKGGVGYHVYLTPQSDADIIPQEVAQVADGIPLPPDPQPIASPISGQNVVSPQPVKQIPAWRRYDRVRSLSSGR